MIMIFDCLIELTRFVLIETIFNVSGHCHVAAVFHFVSNFISLQNYKVYCLSYAIVYLQS